MSLYLNLVASHIIYIIITIYPLELDSAAKSRFNGCEFSHSLWLDLNIEGRYCREVTLQLLVYQATVRALNSTEVFRFNFELDITSKTVQCVRVDSSAY